MKTIHFFLFSLFLVFISCGNKQEKKEELPVIKIEEPVKVVPEVVVEKPLIFSVQIGAFSKENKQFSKIENVITSNENGLFIYRLGAFETYKEARVLRRKLRYKYYGAFVQALKGSERINIQQAMNK